MNAVNTGPSRKYRSIINVHGVLCTLLIPVIKIKAKSGQRFES